MADTQVDIELVADLALDYVDGAEEGLEADLKDAWDAVVAVFPGLTLSPLFSSLDVDVLADMVDGARMSGEEPPDPFTSFSVSCDPSIAEAVQAALQALPFVEAAEIRPATFNAGIISWGTNPEVGTAFQILRAAGGVDAIHGWQVEGGMGRDVRMSVIEFGWDLGHDDLLGADVERFSTFGESFVSHGNAVLGIVLARDNGAGIVGIAPDVRGFLVTPVRAGGVFNAADAVGVAAAAVGPGGVVLIEQGLAFLPGNKPDILWEFNRQTQKAIRLATFFGIIVVEPAGNGGVNFDALPNFEHVQPDKPGFVDSRAIVVGMGGGVGDVEQPEWRRQSKSSFGRRVDCFAGGFGLRAPGDAPSGYQNFGGTSGASAIIAGVVCALQGMALAAKKDPFLPTDIRQLLRDPDLGTPTAAGQPGGIGAMPDLRKIARRLGFARVLPVAAVATTSDAMTLVHLDDEDTLVRREWKADSWGDRIELEPADAAFLLSPHQPAAVSSVETAPARVVTDVVTVGLDGSIHHVFWDTLGQLGKLSPDRSPAATVALGRDLAAVRPLVDDLVIAGIDPAGRLIALRGDARLRLATGLAGPQIIDPFDSYRRCAGPALVTTGNGSLHIVAIDDGGNLRFASGTVLATIGTLFVPPVSAPAAAALDPRVRPGFVTTSGGFVFLGVGVDGLLQSCEIAPVAPFFQPLTAVDASVAVATSGPVALAATANRLLAVAVDTDRRLRFATRSVAPGAPWSTLDPIDPDVEVSPLGGVSAVVVEGTFAVVAVLPDGRPCWSKFLGNGVWRPLLPA